MGNYGFMDGSHMGGWFGMGMGSLLMLAVVVITIGILFALFKSLAGNGSGSRHQDPMEILKQRFARGEIDEEEFINRRKQLQD